MVHWRGIEICTASLDTAYEVAAANGGILYFRGQNHFILSMLGAGVRDMKQGKACYRFLCDKYGVRPRVP